MAKGVVTITAASPMTGVERGARLTISGSSVGSQTFWVVGQKSATVLVVASTWRDSPWVLWFMFVEWFMRIWTAIRDRFRRDDQSDEDGGEDPPLFVPPADDSTDEVTKDPKMLN